MRFWPFFIFSCLFVFLLITVYRLPITKQPLLSPYIPYTIPPSPTPPPQIVTVGMAGDLGLGRHITSTARAKNNFSWSFEKISPWLSQNDFNLANLESPIIKNCPQGLTGTFTFCGDDRFVPYLSSFILNLNNNHMLNYGIDGLNQTKKYLPDTSFYEDFFVKKIGDLSFGFIGYDFVTYPKTDQQEIINRIKLLRSQVDFLIVSLHWGNEYFPQPEKWRVNFAHQLVDAGVDVVHGHHPHVWQGVEIYKNKPIFYSFGNFIFDQSWSWETSHSQIARVTFQKGENPVYKLFPIEIKYNSQPALIIK